MPWGDGREWRYSSTFLNLGTKWRWVVSLTLVPLQPPRKGARYPLERSCVYPRVNVDAVEKRKILYWRELNPGSPARKLGSFSNFFSWMLSFSVFLLERNCHEIQFCCLYAPGFLVWFLFAPLIYRSYILELFILCAFFIPNLTRVIFWYADFCRCATEGLVLHNDLCCCWLQYK
jgi:hypothetical protein